LTPVKGLICVHTASQISLLLRPDKQAMAYKNNILLDLFAGQKLERPPVWVMRQAGRILPGYRKIRAEAGSFKKLVKDAEKIAVVTREPVDVLGVDAAILFSDILVIPEAMGLNYEIVEKKGPLFEGTISTRPEVAGLKDGEDVLPDLDYVFESIDQTKKILAGDVPLIGFAGAPWTLFAYMVEGRGSKTFAKARRLLYEDPETSHALLEKITTSTIAYLKEKVSRGCDVIQLFDSWAGMLPVEHYRAYALPYAERILAAIDAVPTIFFPKGAWSVLPMMGDLPCDAVSLDWKTSAEYASAHLPGKILQGNLDPAQLYGSMEEISQAVHDKIKSFGGRHIFNLGHGVYPDTDFAAVQHMIGSVKEYRYEV